MKLNKIISALEKESESRIKVMPPVTYKYWRKEVHISVVLAKVMNEWWDKQQKFFREQVQEETF